MTSTEAPPITTTQVYRVYIRATADAIWTALTDPEWTDRYAYGGFVHYDLKPGGALVVNPGQEMIDGAAAQGWELPDVIIDGEVIEARPPHLLKSTWRMLMDPGTAAEPRVDPHLRDQGGSATASARSRSSTSCPTRRSPPPSRPASDDLDGGGGGHPWILSDLKSLLETGKRMAD